MFVMSCYYLNPLREESDKKIIDLASGLFIGSGSDGCRRDFSFEYDNEIGALAAASRVRPFTIKQQVRARTPGRIQKGDGEMKKTPRFDYKLRLYDEDGSLVGQEIIKKNDYGVDVSATIRTAAELFTTVETFEVQGEVIRPAE